jgi:hypothetical protein
MNMAEFNELDDVAILHCFKLWAQAGDDPVLAMLCRGLLFRKTFKTIDLSRFDDPQKARSAYTAVERYVAEQGGEPGYEMFFDQASGSGYESFDEGESEILVRDRDGKPIPFGQVSPMSQVLARQVMFRRMHIAPQWRDGAVKIVRGMI